MKKYAVHLVAHHGIHGALVHAETTALALGGAEIAAVWQASRGHFRTK